MHLNDFDTILTILTLYKPTFCKLDMYFFFLLLLYSYIIVKIEGVPNSFAHVPKNS
jgi:hypothetical protein